LTTTKSHERTGDNLAEVQAQLKLALQIADRHKTGRDVAEKLLEQKSSELYRSNEALRKGQENLQQEIAQATSELEVSNARLKRTLYDKSTFINSVSHEIRTPLNAVVGLSELLIKMPMDDTQKDYVNTIFESASSLMKLIRGVLDIAKIENGKINIKPAAVNCSIVATNLRKMCALEAERNNNKIILNVDSNIPEYLLIDEGRYVQIVTNLVGNALKNTRSGEVVISLSIDDGNGGLRLKTNIRDNGVGISKQQRNKIFQAYEQFGNLNHGVGLGLAICRHLIDLMQGELTFESELGVGSEFSFSIPTSQGYEQDIPESLPVSLDSLKNLKVLIAEDNTINQKVLLAQFKQYGIKPIIVDNGRLAVDKLMESDFDVIFLDLQMPVMDGETAIRSIRTEVASGAQQYCVALTATSEYDKREQMLEIGFDDFLSKPLTLSELENALAKIPSVLGAQSNGENPLELEKPSGFDISFLESQFGEAAVDILAQLAPVFLEHSYQELDELRGALAENENSQIKKLSHSLKGALSSMGQVDLAAQLEIMETKAGEIDLNDIFQQITLQMAELKANIEQTLASS
jgi:two-component system sensor histidine kinase/response regulator